MAKEIERKFLVNSDAWRRAASGSEAIVQGYLARGDGVTVRIRIFEDARAVLTIKAGGTAFSRDEYEYEVPLEDGRELLAHAGQQVIAKRRYTVPYAGRDWEVDVFEGRHAGLVLAEIEMESEDARVELPDWVGKDVTGDERYYNSALAGA
ncbi:adenylate cyclase [Devosia sp. UYZn731]|uniref:CYTH domain-containing protein n=1 Tax=Devosia sp. UYZn731 TaxID=3156345 RepID=UPI0033922D69